MICPYCGNLIAYNSYFDVFYCPKCGGFFKQATVMECKDLNEQITLDDAIAHLDDTLSDTKHKWSCESCRQEHVQLRAWLAELREIKQNRNEPLTLDELRQIDGEPVWLVNQNGGRWVIMSGAYLWDSRKNADYGKTWLAYRQKPEEDAYVRT